MKIVTLNELKGTEREVVSPAGWTSNRFLLKADGMGFSMHETVFPANLEVHMWYRHHVEAVYCTAGTGLLTDLETGEEHPIEPGTLYALDGHERHILKAKTEMHFICVFNPPVTGRETHDEDGVYSLPDDVEKNLPAGPRSRSE
ncbi:MAG: ectoine synthase [Alphaproteobacteria bacterium]